MTRDFFEQARYWRLAQMLILLISALAVLYHLGRTNTWSPMMTLFWYPIGVGLNTLVMRYFTFNLPVPRMGLEEAEEL